MITGILRRLGPVARRVAWDREFRGEPSFVGFRSFAMNELCIEVLPGRRVVELACGRGDLWWRWQHEMASYVGFDISSVAVEYAKSRGGDFRVGSMETWEPDGTFDLLIVEEAMYYMTPRRQRELLSKAFAAGARVLMTVHDAVKHAATLTNCESVSRIVMSRTDGSRVFLVLEHAR